jgi:RHS repeat-associated protein
MTSSSDGATYFYDGDGPRVKKVTPSETTYYHYGPGGQLLAETTSLGVTREYFYLGGHLVARTDSSDPTSVFAYLHTDHQGSTIAVTYPSGALVCSPDYEPFGADLVPPGSCSTVRYTGRINDDGTGFYDLGARFYDPGVGRFISSDSVLGDLTNPQSLNKYAYVTNNPYTYIDPTGHELQFASNGPLSSTLVNEVEAAGSIGPPRANVGETPGPLDISVGGDDEVDPWQQGISQERMIT